MNESITTDVGRPARADSSIDNPVPSTSGFSPVIRPMRAEQVRPDSSTMVCSVLLCFQHPLERIFQLAFYFKCKVW